VISILIHLFVQLVSVTNSNSNSNTISLKTTQNVLKHDISTKIDRQSSSLQLICMYHFDKRNYLIEYCHYILHIHV
ncbi:unnamed protein product, partial [Rotaria magnacalcarata]